MLDAPTNLIINISLFLANIANLIVFIIRNTFTNIKAITGKTIVLSKDAEKWILKKVEEEDNGARPIIRILQQYIEETISNMIVEEDPVLNMKKKTITAKLDGDNIILK